MVDERVDESGHWGERRGLALAQVGSWLDLRALSPDWPGQHPPALALEVPLLPQPKPSVGSQALYSPPSPEPQTDTLELLTCEHAPDDSAHACQEVCEGPGRGVGEGQQAPRSLPAQAPPFPCPHLCFSVSFTIMGESSYSTKTPGSP